MRSPKCLLSAVGISRFEKPSIGRFRIESIDEGQCELGPRGRWRSIPSSSKRSREPKNGRRRVQRLAPRQAEERRVKATESAYSGPRQVGAKQIAYQKQGGAPACASAGRPIIQIEIPMPCPRIHHGWDSKRLFANLSRQLTCPLGRPLSSSQVSRTRLVPCSGFPYHASLPLIPTLVR